MTDDVRPILADGIYWPIPEQKPTVTIDAEPLDELRAQVTALQAELTRIQQLARCYRLEDILDNLNNPSETVRTLRAFELAATLRIQLVKAEAEIKMLKSERDNTRVRAAREGR